jgi:choline dehydrogenase-like flavoprotein
LVKRYSSRDLFPFAYRQDNDDVACWSKGSGEKVFVIHDFASPSWEDEDAFDDVWAWFKSAIEETISWD